MLVHPRVSQARPRVSQARPRAEMLLVLILTRILQTCPRVGRVGVILQTHTRVLYTHSRVR
jgi:hypothetical protein